MGAKPKVLFGSLLLLGFMVTLVGFRPSDSPSSPAPAGTLVDLANHPGDPSKILLASEREVYQRGNTKEWKRGISLPVSLPFIRQLVTHPRIPERIFVVTKAGLLEGNLKTGGTRWLYREASISQNQTYALAIHPDHPERFYLATNRGLLTSWDHGATWLYPFRWPENRPVHFVAFSSSLLWIGMDRELFFSKDDGESFESGFSLYFSPEDLTEERSGIPGEEGGNALSLPGFKALSFPPSQGTPLWVGTSQGIFESRDGGVDWEKLPLTGLKDSEIQDLIFSERSGLIAATRREVARFLSKERRWETLPVGLTDTPRSLALKLASNPGETLLIASGVEILEYKIPSSEIAVSEPLFIPSPERIQLFQKILSREPTVLEVQKAAIRYDDMGNGKIQRWHWASRMRSLIPRLSFGRDFSLGNNIDVDRGGTNTPDQFIAGPDKMDKRWDLGLTWELGDSLFSTSQTSIDSRSKLLVELRESVLSQVNRIYFERRRVQIQLVFSPPPKASQEYLDLLLRLQELTAELDARTNGFFTKRLEAIYQGEPELRGLWDLAF